jgi:hypothetical protein
VVSFAKKGENSRTTQLCINVVANSYKDSGGCSPVAEVESGWVVVESINPEYGMNANAKRLKERGNEYIFEKFPKMDYIIKATIVSDGSDAAAESSTKK